MSAYELNGMKDRILVAKSKQIADKLAYAWVGVRHISIESLLPLLIACQTSNLPFGFVDFETDTPIIKIASILLE